MTAKQALGFMTLTTPFLAASLATAGWGWETDPTRRTSPPDGAVVGDKTFEAASRAVLDGRDSEALALIREASLARPSGRSAYLDLARLQFAANQAAKGRRSLEQAASESPTDPRVYLQFGSLALGEGRRSDARLNLDKASSLLEGSKLDARTVLAIRRETFAGLVAVAETGDDWASARTHLLAWLEFEPTNAQARQRLGRALFQLGKVEDSYKELTRATQDDPKLGPAAVTMALLFDRAGNDARAEEWFARASRLEPKSVEARLALARWRLDKGRAAQARPIVEEAAKLDPKSKEVEPLRGLVAWQLRELTAAETIFEALHRDAPADTGFASLLTLALVEQDDPLKRSRGLQMAEVNAREFPKALDLLATLGRAHARSGHLDEAERWLRASIAGAGGRATPTVAYFLAQVLAEKGRRDEARGLLSQATAQPVSFAYEADARKLLKSLEEKNPARTTGSASNRVLAPNR